MIANLQRMTLALIVGFAIPACGGGAGGAAPNVIDDSDPDFNFDFDVDALCSRPIATCFFVGGIWNGLLTYDDATFPDEAILGISADDGRFRFLSLDTDAQFLVQAKTDGVDFSATGQAMAPEGRSWSDGTTATSLTLSGQMNERSDLSAMWRADTTLDAGTINLQYDDAHSRPSAREKLHGTWRSAATTKVLDSVVVDFEAADGNFIGVDDSGCTYAGSMAPNDPDFNMYDLLFDRTNCSNLDGTYEGLGVLLDRIENGTVHAESILAFGADNGVVFVAGRLFKDL